MCPTFDCQFIFQVFFTNCQFALKLTINNNGLPISPKKMFVKMLEQDTKIGYMLWNMLSIGHYG